MLPQRAGQELDNEYRVLDAFKRRTERWAPAQQEDDIVDEQEMCRILGISKMTAYRCNLSTVYWKITRRQLAGAHGALADARGVAAIAPWLL